MIALLLATMIIAFGIQISLYAQQKCALQVAGYLDDDPGGVIGYNYLSRRGNLQGISAYALDWKTRRRFRSVPSGFVRYFGDMPEGDYKIVVGRSGYKTSIYGFHLSCSDAINGVVTQSVRLWKGTPSQIVNNAKEVPSRMKEMRLNTLTVLGNTDGETTDFRSSIYKSSPKTISGGVLDEKAINLPKTSYPPAARAVRASGSVHVQVLIDENGNVVSAHATDGHSLLQGEAERAALQAKFSPTLLSGQPVKVTGIITYTFIP